MGQFIGAPTLAVERANGLTEQGMPTVVNDNFWLDMGRMTQDWFWVAREVLFAGSDGGGAR